MNNEELLDEVEEYLAEHGTVQGVAFSEAAYLDRVKTAREQGKLQAAITDSDQAIKLSEMMAKPVTGMDIIPEMTDPLGKHWSQPDRKAIVILNGIAVMGITSYMKLMEYSTSYPSGVYPGKMWKRINSGTHYLCWYGEEINKQCAIKFLTIDMDSIDSTI